METCTAQKQSTLFVAAEHFTRQEMPLKVRKPFTSAGSHQAEPRANLLSCADPIRASCRASTLGACPTLASLGLSCDACSLHPLGAACPALCPIPLADCALGPGPTSDPAFCPGPACCPGLACCPGPACCPDLASASDVPRYQLLGLL